MKNASGKPNRAAGPSGTSVALDRQRGRIATINANGGHAMRNAKAVTAVFGSMLLAITLTAGMAIAQSGSSDSTKDSTSQPAQPAQPSQPAQSSQPAAPSEMKQSQTDSRTDVRTENRTDRIVETERTKLLGMDPMVAMIVG